MGMEMQSPNDTKRPNSRSGSLGQFYRSRSNMVHVSKRFIRNPLAVQAEMESKPFNGPNYLPLPGDTYNIGRNADKRAAKAARFA